MPLLPNPYSLTPSDNKMTPSDQDKVIDIIYSAFSNQTGMMKFSS